jgi:hypothetical protein
MTDRARRREQLKRGSRRRRLQYAEDISTESFPQWFGRAIRADLERGEVLPEDVRALMLPPQARLKHTDQCTLTGTISGFGEQKQI